MTTTTTTMPAPDFKTLTPELYRHPGERAARAKLEKIPGFGKFTDMIAANFTAAARRQTEIASMARVGAAVYPGLHALWENVRTRFGLPAVPLHVSYGSHDAGRPAALRGDNERPAVVLAAPLLTAVSAKEMETVLTMQAASIRLGNATLLVAADMVRWFLDAYGVAGAPALPLAWGMENWRRYALFSADRAAALAAPAPDGVLAHLARLAGAGENAWGGVTDTAALRVQGLEAVSRATAGEGAGKGSRFMRAFALAMHRDNTVALIRRADVEDWFASGVPARIASGEITAPEQMEWDSRAEPSAAYWGEFAGCCEEDEDAAGGKSGMGGGIGGIAADAATQAFGELRESAEKGLDTLFRAGGAFWNTLTENSRKENETK